jgi:hypothetical protein
MTWLNVDNEIQAGVSMNILRSLAIAVALIMPGVVSADPVKMSTSNICHCPGGTYYGRTTNFRAYDSIDACLAGGGRHPKSGQGSCQAVSATPAMSKLAPQPVSSSGRYDRDLFGGWADADGDCQNTRHERLAELSTGPVRYSSDGCRVTRGRWNDPYSGQIYLDAGDLDIDHLVPLAYAWSRGADSWSDAKRRQFANDPVNLFAVQASANRQKGAAGPTEWLPANAGFHCQYLLHFVRVSKTYGLKFSHSEGDAIQRMIQQKNCG